MFSRAGPPKGWGGIWRLLPHEPCIIVPHRRVTEVRQDGEATSPRLGLIPARDGAGSAFGSCRRHGGNACAHLSNEQRSNGKEENSQEPHDAEIHTSPPILVGEERLRCLPQRAFLLYMRKF